MAWFRYRAVGADGKVCQGVEEFESDAQASTALLQRGMTPLRIEPAGKASSAAATSGKPRARRVMFGGSAMARLMEFTRELSIMLSAGMPLDRSLKVLADMAVVPENRELISGLREDVRRGRALADAMEQRSEFSSFYVNMVRAGETGGALELALSRLAAYLERSKALKQTVASALIYPTILLVVAACSVALLLGFVVPKFAELFEDMGAALPAPTRMVMAAGDWMASYWWLLILVVGGGAWLFTRQLQQPGFRAVVDRQLLRVPVAGELVRNLEAARFSRTLATLLHAGVSIVGALSIAANTVSNVVMRAEIKASGEGLKQGRMLSQGLLESAHFPLLATHMIQVGEESGKLEEMLAKVADIFDEEVAESVKRLLALLEPVLILGLGVMIAGIILSILVGIMGINDLAF